MGKGRRTEKKKVAKKRVKKNDISGLRQKGCLLSGERKDL